MVLVLRSGNLEEAEHVIRRSADAVRLSQIANVLVASSAISRVDVIVATATICYWLRYVVDKGI